MELTDNSLLKGDEASEDVQGPLYSGRQDRQAGYLLNQEVAGPTKMSVRLRTVIRNMLQWRLLSIRHGYSREKAELALELREPTEQMVRAAGSHL